MKKEMLMEQVQMGITELKDTSTIEAANPRFKSVKKGENRQTLAWLQRSFAACETLYVLQVFQIIRWCHACCRHHMIPQ
jgi:hypothetical protein